MKKLVPYLLSFTCILGIGIGIPAVILQQIERKSEAPYVVRKERPEPFSSDSQSTEEFLSDALRAPELLLELDDHQ